LYKEVYDLIEELAFANGFSEVDQSLRWPGQFEKDHENSPAVCLQTALNVAEEVVATNEEAGVPYSILGRSFGTCVALRLAQTVSARHLRKIILWGAPAYTVVWDNFVRQLAEYREKAKSKHVKIDEQFFTSLEPVEWLLPQMTIPTRVATGSEDAYCNKAFHNYLAALCAGNPLVEFPSPVPGAPHEFTKKQFPALVPDYAGALFGQND
jgi:hypothetical protein